MNCLPENNLRAYHDAELTAAQDAEIEAHLGACRSCSDRLRELTGRSERVRGHLEALGSAASATNVDAHGALSRFKAQHGGPRESVPLVAQLNVDGPNKTSVRTPGWAKRWRPVWVGAVAATILLCSLAFPFGRGLAQRFLGTLRVEKVQPVRLDFSALDGNRPLQEMLRQMISDKVVVTADEKPQPASTAADASQVAGFSAHVLGARTDAPKFVVGGQHAFHMTIDRTRLQDIFDQAGRADLLLPATLDGANVSVNVPRSIMVEYGDCPEAHPAGRTQPAPTQPRPAAWANCLALQEVPSPLVNMPSDLNLQQLAEIGFQLTGMSATQARDLGQSIDWKSTLVLPIPRSASSYSQVTVNGVQGTLIQGSGRRGPDYVLVWVKNGMIYGLVGHGDSSNAVALANSLK
jgi:putative zinc finger protein